MKRTILLLSIITLGVLSLSSCKDEDDDPSACNTGFNFCVDMDGTLIEGNATFVEINSNRYRVLWETGSGTTYKNIEIDIYATSSGTFDIDSTGTSNNAQFQYFDGTGYYGSSGQVVVDNVSTAEISGTFNAVADDRAGNVKNFTAGNFVNVPK